jgi:hypothetical protein
VDELEIATPSASTVMVCHSEHQPACITHWLTFCVFEPVRDSFAHSVAPFASTTPLPTPSNPTCGSLGSLDYPPLFFLLLVCWPCRVRIWPRPLGRATMRAGLPETFSPLATGVQSLTLLPKSARFASPS